MSALTVSSRSSPPPAERPASPDTPLRQAFEHELRQAGRRRLDEDAPPGEAPATPDWTAPPMQAPRIEPTDTAAADGRAPVLPAAASLAADVAPAADGARAPVAAAPSRVFDQLATPLQATAGHVRFEVLHGAAVTGITIDPAGPGSRAEVTVVAPAAQVAVLVHHLPQLQRRLADRVTVRVRAGDRDAEQER